MGTPEPPPLTEQNLEDQSGKVFIVTGSTSGIGKQLAGILYQHNAKVYIASRNAAKATATIKEFQYLYPTSTGSVIFLRLELDDLSGIKASAEEFLRQESRLDVLWNNAGVMIPPQGSKSKQGYELQLGTNCLGPFLFTKLLTPILAATAKHAPKHSVRVVWLSSSSARAFAPKGGVEMDNLDYKKDRSIFVKYGTSKAGVIFESMEFARRYAKDRLMSVSLDPGILKTDIRQNMPWWQNVIANLIHPSYEPIYGAYTELFAGLSKTLTSKDNGSFIEPWGKIGSLRKDIDVASRTKTTSAPSIAEQFWEWNEKETLPYT